MVTLTSNSIQFDLYSVTFRQMNPLQNLKNVVLSVAIRLEKKCVHINFIKPSKISVLYALQILPKNAVCI